MRRLICAVVLATSCHGHSSAPPPAEPAGLELISRGFLPRAPLRYALAKGTKAALVLDVESTLAAGTLAQASPPLHVAFDVAVDDVLPDGRMTLTSTVHAIDVGGDGPDAAHAAAVGSAAAGLAITATLSPDGGIADVHATDRALPEAAKAELAQIIARFPQLAFPLPAVPVGVGAQWRISRALGSASNLALDAVTTIQITARTGASFSYVLASQLTGSDQTAMQDGTSVETTGISGSATGGGTIDLARLAIDATQSAELHAEMTIGSDRTPMTMTQTIRASSH